MRTINITAEAESAMRSASIRPFQNNGTRRPDGTWDVSIDDETHARLIESILPGESVSDTIIRLVVLYSSGGRAQ